MIDLIIIVVSVLIVSAVLSVLFQIVYGENKTMLIVNATVLSCSDEKTCTIIGQEMRKQELLLYPYCFPGEGYTCA